MARRQPWWTALLLPFLLAAVGLSSAASVSPDACQVPTAVYFILRPPEPCSTLDRLGDPVGVIEGDEVTLARAVNLFHMNKDDYIAVLFYASWCPFSQECKPNFKTLASLFPTIRHFAFEESAIRPSIMSRYGIHGFPTLFLLTSTMRVRYQGPRTVKLLAAFYTDVSGINASVKSTAGEAVVHSLDDIEHKKDAEQENCPFWWARSPEKILQQDTYLALATAFVILRLLYLLFPKIDSFARWTWRRHTLFANLMGVHEYFLTYLEQARQKFHRVYPSKRGNLQEGAMNATAWASKSLASVSIGEPSAIGMTNSTSELR
ncbi:5'-adenylylsulfate reductase-like 3 [Phragmites australis]|uniref:5'-adenylylsulfate reductase-like 3 n=1 Tax=Phragmites australis TaxID=29695 RepID=UPI002D774DB7|nr:5'-adenylylsulfate reductase-like 3 [Phragmites australis]